MCDHLRTFPTTPHYLNAQAERCRMILGREESLPEAPNMEDVTPVDESIAEHCAAIECKGNFMFDPV